MTTNRHAEAWRCPECRVQMESPGELDAHWEQHHMRPATKLRRRLASGPMVLAPFCLNAFHARIAESLGFDAVYMTGSGTAADRGFTDVGLITQTEMVQNAGYIARAVKVPVICDADTGYGNPINVYRTVREYEAAGVAALHLEDQIFPKKCGFFEGKEVIPAEEHVQKIRAARDARSDANFVIIARTDALDVTGWEDAVRRCRVYAEAGADLIYMDGIRTREDIERYARELGDLPRVYVGGILPAAEVERLGFKVMISGGTPGVVYRAVKAAMQELKDSGQVSPSRGATLQEVANLLGLPEITQMEQRYGIGQPGPRPVSK